MKFEKFIKRAGINAVIVTDPDGRKWIYNDGVAMIIPPCFVDNYGDAAYKIPADIFGAINDIDPDVTDPAVLTRAQLPADGKAKEIERVYTDADFDITIRNADWSLIERNDNTFIAVDDNDEAAALVIYLGENIRGVIFPIGFSINDLDEIN